MIDDYGVDPETVRWAAWAVTVFAGLTMVSNFKYYSFKTINLRRSVPFVAVFGFVLFFVLVSYQPPIVLFAGFLAYALSGYVWSAWLALKRRRTLTVRCIGTRRRSAGICKSVALVDDAVIRAHDTLFLQA